MLKKVTNNNLNWFYFFHLLVISEIKPIKEKLSKTMKNIDVLYANSSLEGFVRQLNDKKMANLNKIPNPAVNKSDKFHELRALDK